VLASGAVAASSKQQMVAAVVLVLGVVSLGTRGLVLLAEHRAPWVVAVAAGEAIVIGLAPIVVAGLAFGGSGITWLRRWLVVGMVDAGLWLVAASIAFVVGGALLSGTGHAHGHGVGGVIGGLFMAASLFRAGWSLTKIVALALCYRQLRAVSAAPAAAPR
jgi:hypothetical protein